MSEVISFKVRKEIKKKVEMLKSEVNWAEELRKFVEMKIREIEAKKNKNEVVERLKRASWQVPKGFSSNAVREDREGH